jgi:uncharacterized protein YdhG (YjbR/CyaY superfamily)
LLNLSDDIDSGQADVDAYIAALPEPKRSTLEEVRRRILAVIPNATQKISYGMPGFVVNGKVVAGIAAFKNHCAFLPHSGRVFVGIERHLEGFMRTMSSLHFRVDEPLSQELVGVLIEEKMQVLEADGWTRP